MAVNLPESLVNLPSNCGIFALWMLFQHHGIDKNIYELAESCQHDEEEGIFTIALAVTLKKMGFDVTFHSAPDPNIDARERFIYTQAERLKVAIQSELSYQGIIEAIKQGKFVIVFYDTLDGTGHQSLVHSIDENEICFFDNFSSMSAKVFEQQRNAEGICQQVIIVDDQNFNTLSTKMN